MCINLYSCYFPALFAVYVSLLLEKLPFSTVVRCPLSSHATELLISISNEIWTNQEINFLFA